MGDNQLAENERYQIYSQRKAGHSQAEVADLLERHPSTISRELRRIEKRVKEHYGAAFSYDDDVLINIVARCQESDTGARNIEVILNRTLLPSLASECLDKMAKGEEVSSIHIGATEEGDFSYEVN